MTIDQFCVNQLKINQSKKPINTVFTSFIDIILRVVIASRSQNSLNYTFTILPHTPYQLKFIFDFRHPFSLSYMYSYCGVKQFHFLKQNQKSKIPFAPLHKKNLQQRFKSWRRLHFQQGAQYHFNIAMLTAILP